MMPDFRFRSILKSLLAVILLLTAVGCLNREERTEDGRIVINYWEKWTNFEREAMERLVKEYNDSQDKVFVRFVSTSQIDRKLLLATAGGNPPDVAGFWSHSMVSYVDKGALIPLDHLMKRDGISTDDYVPSIIDSSKYRGFIWGLPTTPATVAIHYNKDHFREAGIDPEHPPKTIEEMNRYCRVLTERDEDGSLKQVGFNPNDPGWWGPLWVYFFNGDLVSEDGRELLCTSPKAIQAYSWVQSLADMYGGKDIRLFESAHRGEFASASNSFMTGKVSMKLQGVWMANFIETFGPDVDWGAAPFPAVEEGMEPATVVECDMLVIPKGARHVEEAWDFIKFVQERKNMEQLCLDQRKFSPLKEVSPEFYEKHPNPYIRLFRELAESPNARAVPKIPIWPEYRDELGVALEKIWIKGGDVEDSLNAVKQRIQPKLDRAWERWELVADKRIEEWSTP